jgi:outer membrane protein assembly factor BamB
VIDGNGHLYIQGADPASSLNWNLWCINTSDCSVIWQCHLGTADVSTLTAEPLSSCAVASDGTIYVGFEEDFVAVNSAGVIQWRRTLGDYIRSSPVIGADGTIYVGCDDNYLYAINPDNTIKWSYLTGGNVISAPALSSDGTIYAGSGSGDGCLHAIHPDGTVKWTYGTGSGIGSSPAVGSDGTIYIGGGVGYLYAIRSDGTLKWSYSTGGQVLSSPAIDDGRGVLFVGSNDDCICAVRTTDGSEKWRTNLQSWVGYSSPAIALPNNTVYIGDARGHFYILNGETGDTLCYNTHDWDITSPVVDEENGDPYCVWYNEWSVAVRKVCWSPTGVEEERSSKKRDIYLGHSPNPSGAGTRISFYVPTESRVVIDIYDITGRLMQTLASGNYSAGDHAVDWDAEGLRDGIYFCKLTTPTRTLTRKLVLVK